MKVLLVRELVSFSASVFTFWGPSAFTLTARPGTVHVVLAGLDLIWLAPLIK